MTLMLMGPRASWQSVLRAQESNFWRVFDVFLDLVKFALFNAISIDFYAVKSFICINFV